MAINNKNQFTQYIDSLMDNLKAKSSLTVGTRKEGSNIGEDSFTSGINNAAQAPHSAAIGSNNYIPFEADSAVVLGEGNQASSKYQFVHGKFNDLDANNNYAHIIGGGEPNLPKNIYTLDWKGNAWFRGGIIIGGENAEQGQEIATKDYLDQNIAIKFFPYYEIDENTVKIYANELDPYTIYKVKMNGKYNRIQFYVKTQYGEIPFLHSDSTINKYNMFVSEKTDKEMMLIINSMLYKIDLVTGRVEKVIDGSFAGPGMGGSEDVPKYAEIDDNAIDANKTWSSYQISKELERDFNEARIESGKLILGRNKKDLVELNLPTSSGSGISIDDSDINRWNAKMDRPIGGKPGQVLILDSNENLVWGNATGSSGGTASKAEDVQYLNGDITTVQEALDKLLYTAPKIISFSADKPFGVYEVGDNIEVPIIFKWSITHSAPLELLQLTDVDSLTVDSVSGSYSLGNIKQNKTFTLRIQDTKGGSYSVNGNYIFAYATYYGVSTEPNDYNEVFIRSLANKKLDFKSGNFTVNAKANQYIYLCVPLSYNISTFTVGGFDGGFERVKERYIFKNDKGENVVYSIWKSDNHSLGNTTVYFK